MRKPVVAGSFYLSDKSSLNMQIESCFLKKFGPGNLPRAFPVHERKYGLIVPHAGYPYSGECASHAYKSLVEVKKSDLPETFIILGPNHTGHGQAVFSLSLENFETPLGLVENDTEFGEKLIEESSPLAQKDEIAHQFEHSIEVQLPFLQFCYNMMKKEFKIVPIIVSTIDYDNCVKIAKIIAKIAKEQKKKVCVIASSDFTHHGPSYGFIPFTKDIKNNLYTLDRNAINKILKLDSKGFHELAIKSTICGLSTIVVCIEASKALGAKKASLLKYYTSGDVLGDYANAVGYASIAFE